MISFDMNNIFSLEMKKYVWGPIVFVGLLIMFSYGVHYSKLAKRLKTDNEQARTNGLVTNDEEYNSNYNKGFALLFVSIVLLIVMIYSYMYLFVDNSKTGITNLSNLNSVTNISKPSSIIDSSTSENFMDEL